MARKPTVSAPTPRSIASYVESNAPKVRDLVKRKHQPTESVREADYQGHHIVVRTSYQIEVDGKMLMGHMGVTNDGRVHYHPVPNLAFTSAIDLVKQLIDIFPGDFGETHGTHGGSHDHLAARPNKAAKSRRLRR